MTVRQVMGRVVNPDYTPVEGATLTAQVTPDTVPEGGVPEGTVLLTTAVTNADGVWTVTVTSDYSGTYTFSTLTGLIVGSQDGTRLYATLNAPIPHGDGSPAPLTAATDPVQTRV